jgi:hypothetical protein
LAPLRPPCVNGVGGRRSSCAVIHGMERDGGVNLLIAIGAFMVASMAYAVNRNSLMVGRQNLNSRHIALAIRKAFCRPGSTQTHSPCVPRGRGGAPRRLGASPGGERRESGPLRCPDGGSAAPRSPTRNPRWRRRRVGARFSGFQVFTPAPPGNLKIWKPDTVTSGRTGGQHFI